MFMVHRRWELHVWELTGPESTWQQQLEQHLAREPVFAVLSGLGGRNWAPVHAFCEQRAVPCLFPNVEVPIDNAGDFYSVYFSKGVLLEAELIANALAHVEGGTAPTTVWQVYRAGDIGEAAAARSAAALEAQRRGGVEPRRGGRRRRYGAGRGLHGAAQRGCARALAAPGRSRRARQRNAGAGPRVSCRA